jgi:hypothetical protein
MIDDPKHPVSAGGLGGYEFEDDPSCSGARDVLTAAIDAGIDWLDTSEGQRLLCSVTTRRSTATVA